MMNDINVVLFDLGGTLVYFDSDWSAALRQAGARKPSPMTAEYANARGIRERTPNHAKSCEISSPGHALARHRFHYETREPREIM